MSYMFLGTADGNKFKGGIYMVFEYMDHDLTGLADRPGLRFTVPQIKVLFFWKIKSICFVIKHRMPNALLICSFNFFFTSVIWSNYWQGSITVMLIKFFIET